MEKKSGFEEALMARLSDRKLNKTTLKKYSSIIADIRRQDIIIDSVCKYGQPEPDGILVRGRVGIKEFDKLSRLFANPDIFSLEIFPLGILAPDLLDVRFKLGEQVLDR